MSHDAKLQRWIAERVRRVIVDEDQKADPLQEAIL
jgi:hypothetical protein